MIRKDLVIAILATFCLTSVLFLIPASSSGIWSYDPWWDINDDGRIDINDLARVAGAFGTYGPAINKTEALLDLQSRVNALEKRVPKKGYVCIAPAAFSPETNTHSYTKDYNKIQGQGNFWVALQLPNNVTLTNITAHIHDYVTNGLVSVALLGYNLTKDSFLTIPMALMETTSSGAPGSITLYDDTIADARIDTRNCYYSLYVYFTYDDWQLQLWGIKIEYEYPA